VQRPYGVADVEKLLRLPRSTIRALIAAGFVAPARGPRSAWRFSFQDLIVLRTAQALADANVSPRRITRSLRELRRSLPATMPLSGLSIGAVADRVVVREGSSQWQAESGQYLLEFEGDPVSGAMSVIEHRASMAASGSAREWFERATELERQDAAAAIDAYERAIAADPALLDASINLGRLLHEAGRLPRAEAVYRGARKACGDDPLLLYNLAVLLEDMNRGVEAAAAYEVALRGEPDLADAHYNLGLLYRELGRPKQAIRHMARYRALTAPRSK
jgi:tetratricopeptide (TPR) repeat protein